MDPLRDLIATRGRMVLSIRREVVRSGEVLAEDERTVTLDGGRWDDPSVGEYSFDSVDDGGWQAQGDLAYVETSITAVGDGWFHSHFQPSHYSIYVGPDRKTFFSDNNWKFGNPNTIKQIATFGKWVEGYPVAHVDAALDAGESLVVINPFEAETSVKIHLQGHDDLSVRRSIAPLGGTRIDLGAALGPDRLPWSGQVLVSGPARLVVYFAKHGFADTTQINTIEHSDVYRGTMSYRPLTQNIRRWVGPWLGRS